MADDDFRNLKIKPGINIPDYFSVSQTPGSQQTYGIGSPSTILDQSHHPLFPANAPVSLTPTQETFNAFGSGYGGVSKGVFSNTDGTNTSPFQFQYPTNEYIAQQGTSDITLPSIDNTAETPANSGIAPETTTFPSEWTDVPIGSDTSGATDVQAGSQGTDTILPGLTSGQSFSSWAIGQIERFLLLILAIGLIIIAAYFFAKERDIKLIPSNSMP